MAKKDEDGVTALHAALREGRYQVANTLLDAGMDIDILHTGSGFTPLHTAVFGPKGEGCYAMCARLLSAGANLEAKDYDGFTPLSLLIAYMGYNSIESWEILNLLLSLGADVNTTDNDKNTPLHSIVCSLSSVSDKTIIAQRAMLLEWLCDCGANANLKNNFGLTPLQLLARRKFIPQDTTMAFLGGLGAPLVVALVKGGNRNWELVPSPCLGIGGALLSIWKSAPEDLGKVYERLDKNLKSVGKLMLKILHRRLPSPGRAELRMAILSEALS